MVMEWDKNNLQVFANKVLRKHLDPKEK